MTPHTNVWTSQTLNINNFKNIRNFSVLERGEERAPQKPLKINQLVKNPMDPPYTLK